MIDHDTISFVFYGQLTFYEDRRNSYMFIDLPYEANNFHVVINEAQGPRTLDIGLSGLIELIGMDKAYNLIDPMFEGHLVYHQYDSFYTHVADGRTIVVRQNDPIFKLPCGSWFYYTACSINEMCGPFLTESAARTDYMRFSSW